jgi:hypothetical protein
MERHRTLLPDRGDMRARLQLLLSVDHDLLVGLESGINQRLATTDLRDLLRRIAAVLSGLTT